MANSECENKVSSNNILVSAVRKLRQDEELSVPEKKALNDFLLEAKRYMRGYLKEAVSEVINELYDKIRGIGKNGEKTGKNGERIGKTFDDMFEKFGMEHCPEEEQAKNLRAYMFAVLRDLAKKYKQKENRENNSKIAMDLNGIILKKPRLAADDDSDRERETGREELSSEWTENYDEDDYYHDNTGDTTESYRETEWNEDSDDEAEKESDENGDVKETSDKNENGAPSSARTAKMNAEEAKISHESEEESFLYEELKSVMEAVIKETIDKIEEQDSTAKIFRQFYKNDKRYKEYKVSGISNEWVTETLNNRRIPEEGGHAVVFVLFFPWNGWKMKSDENYGYESAAAYINCKSEGVEFDPENSDGKSTIENRYKRIAGFMREIFMEKEYIGAQDTDKLAVLLDLLVDMFEERKPEIVLCKKKTGKNEAE